MIELRFTSNASAFYSTHTTLLPLVHIAFLGTGDKVSGEGRERRLRWGWLSQVGISVTEIRVQQEERCRMREVSFEYFGLED